jgi:Ca2+-binding RTX toxin-like protein
LPDVSASACTLQRHHLSDAAPGTLLLEADPRLNPAFLRVFPKPTDKGAIMAILIGTEDDNFIFGTAEADEISALGGNVFGAGGNDTADGGTGNDTLAGGDGDDVLLGGDGNDEIVGNAGAADLTGGTGDDRYVWQIGSAFSAPADSTSLARDVVHAFEGAGVAGGDTLQLVESDGRRIVFDGARAMVPAVGATIGSGSDNLLQVFYAFDGADTVLFADSDDDGVLDADDFSVRLAGRHNLTASDFADTAFAIVGTSGNNIINGTDGNDIILGLGGNDIVNGGAGDDDIEGGSGNDILNGGAGNDAISGGDGNDIIDGGAGDDFFRGGLRGGAGNDIINGGDGRDAIHGEDGNDIIDGGNGSDTILSGGNGNDIVRGGAGNDTLDGDAGVDQLFGGIGNDDLFGEDGNDLLYGEDGNDLVEGLDGNDQLFGGNGRDELIGDAGADRQTGGAGEDEFTFFLGSFNPSSPFSAPDTVLDFEGAGVAGGDEIRLSELLLFRGDLHVNPVAGAALPGGGNGLTDIGYSFKSGSTWLIADDDDDGRLDGADFAVKFSGTHAFTEDDFGSTSDFVIAGTDGDDIITGTPDDDTIFGFAGNDTIDGGDGNDTVSGGAGNDLLIGSPDFGFDLLSGDEGDDTITLALAEFGGVANGGAGNDTLIGSDQPFGSFSQLMGDAGSDELIAGEAGAEMNGGTGTDRLVSSAANDTLAGGRDEFGILDGAQDLFVYGATPWGSDTVVFEFEDGVDLFDLRGSGLTFGDLTIVNDAFQDQIISSLGQIDILERLDEPVDITAADFLFA